MDRGDLARKADVGVDDGRPEILREYLEEPRPPVIQVLDGPAQFAGLVEDVGEPAS